MRRLLLALTITIMACGSDGGDRGSWNRSYDALCTRLYTGRGTTLTLLHMVGTSLDEAAAAPAPAWQACSVATRRLLEAGAQLESASTGVSILARGNNAASREKLGLVSDAWAIQEHASLAVSMYKCTEGRAGSLRPSLATLVTAVERTYDEQLAACRRHGWRAPSLDAPIPDPPPGPPPAGSEASPALPDAAAQPDAAAPQGSAAPSSAGSLCSGIIATWDAELDRANGACKTDADCACFNGGISQTAPCGGVTGKASAATLDKIRQQFTRASCESGIACAAWVCEPRCISGACRR